MTGNFRWGVGTTTMTDGQLLREPTRNEAEDGDTADASDVLRDLLANGPVEVELARKTVMTTAGVSLRTVGSVKRRLKVKSTHPGGRGPWYWELPEADSRARTRAGNNPNVAPCHLATQEGKRATIRKNTNGTARWPLRQQAVTGPEWRFTPRSRRPGRMARPIAWWVSGHEPARSVERDKLGKLVRPPD
jgi:hypothetical protein